MLNGYIDLHCDTLAVAYERHIEDIFSLDGSMVDIRRLQLGGASAQFFALFLPQETRGEWFIDGKMPPLGELMQRMRHILEYSIGQHSDVVAFARNAAEWQRNRSEGKLSAFLTIENGALAEGDMERLRDFHNAGVRLLTLTWNHENCFGTPHSEDAQLMRKGLTAFGREAVPYLNELGILIDVSHLSDGGFYDVAALSRKPFVASHSNCRSICGATRNLTDDMIRTLAEKGGMAGINFAPFFVNPDVTDDHTSVEMLVEHILHFINTGGEDCVGIGSDFDGIGGDLEIADCSKMPVLFEEMERRGLSPRMIEKVAYQNAARVIADTM